LGPSGLQDLSDHICSGSKICEAVGAVSGGDSGLDHRPRRLLQIDSPSRQAGLSWVSHAVAVEVVVLDPRYRLGYQLVSKVVIFGFKGRRVEAEVHGVASPCRIDLGPAGAGGLADLVLAWDQPVEFIGAVWRCGCGPRLQWLAKPGISGQDYIPSALPFSSIFGPVSVLVVILHAGYGIHPHQPKVGFDHGAAGYSHYNRRGRGQDQAARDRIADGISCRQDVLEGVNSVVVGGGVGHNLAVQQQADIASGNAGLICILRSVAVDIVVFLSGYGEIPHDPEVPAGNIGIGEINAVGALRRKADLPALLGRLGYGVLARRQVLEGI